METVKERLPNGLPKGMITYTHPDKAIRPVNQKVLTAIDELPAIPFTVTSLTSTAEEDKILERKSATHLEGRALDVRYDDNGHKLVGWITQTSEGNAWAKRHGVSILPHGDKGNNMHYHIQFSR